MRIAILVPLVLIALGSGCGKAQDSAGATDKEAVRDTFLEFVERFLGANPARACDLLVQDARERVARELSDKETSDCPTATAIALRGTTASGRRRALERAGEAAKVIEVDGDTAYVGRGSDDEAKLVRSGERWLIEEI